MTIYYLEGRKGLYLYHFFIYNLGGLYYILNKKFIRGPPNTSILLDIPTIQEPTRDNNLTFPIKIHMKDILPFQREAFEIIKDKFELVEELPTSEEIVSIYGEIQTKTGTSDNKEIIFPFLRNLFLEKCQYKMISGKKIYITRKNSEKQHYGVLKRHILNEPNFIELLNKHNIEYIQLENYSMQNKIKLFMESELIISPHSSCLTLLLFANQKSKIIEITNKGTVGFSNHHMLEIANVFELNFHRYSNINEDYNGNFNIDINDFEKYLSTI